MNRCHVWRERYQNFPFLPKEGKNQFRKADGKTDVNLNEPNLKNTRNQIPGFLVKQTQKNITLPARKKFLFTPAAIPVTSVRKLFPDDGPPERSTCDENAWSIRGKTWDELECFRGYLIHGIFGGFPEDTFELTRFIPSS